MDEAKLISEADRGRRAKRLLEDEIFREAHQKVQDRIFNDFSACDPQDTERMRHLRLKLNCLAEVMRELAQVMTSGKVAEEQLAQERTLRERIRAMRRGWRP